MPLPASLIASIVSAVIEAAAQSSGSTTGVQQYEYYTATRTLPPEAKLGVMFPPLGDGFVVINGTSLRLAPTAQFRSEQNLIVMPMTIQSKKDVVYLADAYGAVFRVWMLRPAEVSAHPKD
jgi:hypothetical protein